MPTGEHAQRGPSRRRGGHGWLLFLVSFAMLIVSLDQYIVVVALPDIGRDLGYSAQTLQRSISAYAVASSGFLLLGGRAADLLGRRRMLVTGLALYAVASLAGGLATGPAIQLTARAVQGLGGALVFPAPSAIINTTFAEGRDRNRALGIWGGSGAAGLVVGVLAGGVLTRSSAGNRCSSSTCRSPAPRSPWRSPRSGGPAARHGAAGSTCPARSPRCRR